MALNIVNDLGQKYIHKNTISMGCVLVFLLLWVCPSAFGIVSVEQERFKPLKPGLQGSVEGTFKLNSGNSTQDSWSAGTALRWGWHGAEWLWLSDRAYSTAEGVTITDKGWTHLRWYQPSEGPFGVEAFTQLSKNTFTSLVSRSVLGAGTRIRLIENANQEMLFLGLGAFHEKEQLQNQVSLPVNRGNLYWSWFFQSEAPKVKWGQVLYVQPNLQNSRDYRLLEQLSLKLHLSKKVFLHLGVNLSLDNHPPIGVKKTDRTYELTLGANF